MHELQYVFITLALAVTAHHFPAAVVGYAFLLLALVRLPRDVFVLWLLYSGTYWAAGAGREDTYLLLAITTAAQILALVAHVFYSAFEDKLWHPLMALLLLPDNCTILYYSPLFSVFRAGLFVGLRHLDPDAWLVHQMALFSKKTTLPIVLLVYLAWRFKLKETPAVVALLPVHAPQPPVQPPVDPLEAKAARVIHGT